VLEFIQKKRESPENFDAYRSKASITEFESKSAIASKLASKAATKSAVKFDAVF
jgi:hypothetical protein